MRLLATVLLILPSCHLRDHYAAWLIEQHLAEPWFTHSIAASNLNGGGSQGSSHKRAANPAVTPPPAK